MQAHADRFASGVVIAIIVLAAAACFSPSPSRAADEWKYGEDEAVCAKTDTSGRMFWVLDAVIDARSQLSAYDTKLVLLRAMDEPHPYLTALLNEERGDLLHLAMSAFYFTGPMYFPDDLGELQAALHDPGLSYFYMQNPVTLDELVEHNILPYLPESPYATGGYFYAVPEAQPVPGTVVYYSYEIEGEYLSGVPHAREGYVLAVYGRPGNWALPNWEVEQKMLGDLSLVEPYKYSNLVFFLGMDPDTIE